MPADHASNLPDVSGYAVGILGGTGDQGRGLAYRFARAGLAVRIGSRPAPRGARAAAGRSPLPGAGGHPRGGATRKAPGAAAGTAAAPRGGRAALVPAPPP